MPAVRASLAERFIFNFRLPMQMLASYLPISWLAPEEVRGYGVASFCILDLRGITVAPLTTQIGLSSISCAPRYAVLDLSHEQASPAVFVTERQTNSALGTYFTALGFSAPHPEGEAVIDHQGDRTLVRVDSLDGGSLFAATVCPSAAPKSELFASPQEFADFIAQGVSSYGRSRHRLRLAGCAWADTCARARERPSEYAALIELAKFLRLQAEQHAIAHWTHPVLHRRQLRPSAGLSVLALEDLRASAVTTAEQDPVRRLREPVLCPGSGPPWYFNRRGLNTDDPLLFGRLIPRPRSTRFRSLRCTRSCRGHLFFSTIAPPT